LSLIRKVDSTFQIREDQRYTAVNSQGFEVDIIRREAVEDDPQPMRLTDAEDEFYAVQARRAGVLMAGPRFSSMIVATNGAMARMNTVSPLVFASFKRWMAGTPDREALKRGRDLMQAELVVRFTNIFTNNVLFGMIAPTHMRRRSWHEKHYGLHWCSPT